MLQRGVTSTVTSTMATTTAASNIGNRGTTAAQTSQLAPIQGNFYQIHLNIFSSD